MKILAIADQAPKRRLLDIVRAEKIDLICMLGDLDFFMLKELEKITNIPKIGVYGNHCSGQYFEPLGITNMHLQIHTFNGLTFGGFEGSVRYKNSTYGKMYTQEEADILLKDFGHVDVMLSHCPPYGINDEPNALAHQGFHALRNYVEDQKPRYLFHSHTYPTDDTLITKYKNTEIIYVFCEMIITLPDII